MKNVYLVGLSVVLSMSVACAAETDRAEGGSTHPLRKDETLDPVPNPNAGCMTIGRPSSGLGLANPASVYCAELGYVAEGETCAFPDGTSCEQWAFFRGECGQAHSFCHRQGGDVSVADEDIGGFIVKYALCTLPTGTSCKEQDFAATCRCE